MANATDTFGIILKNDVRECARLRKAIEEFSALNKFPQEERFELQLCLQEAVMNIVTRGCDDGEEHDIDVQVLFQRKGRILLLRIADDGKTLNSLGESSLPDHGSQVQRQSPEDSVFYSVRKYADDMSYFRQGRINHLILSKVISATSDSSPAEPSA